MKTMNRMVAIIIVMIAATFTSLAGRGDNEVRRSDRGVRTEPGRPVRVAQRQSPNEKPDRQKARPHNNAPAAPARPHQGRPAPQSPARPHADRPQPGRPHHGQPAPGHRRPVVHKPVRLVPMGPGPVRYMGSINRNARPFYLDNRRYYHYDGAFYRYHPGYGYSVVSVPYYSYFPVIPFPCRQVFVGPDSYWVGDGSWFVEEDGGFVLVERPSVPVYGAPLPPAPPVVPAKPHVSIEFSF